MPDPIPDDPRRVLEQCLEIAQELSEAGREEEACRYLAERVLPALDEWAQQASREARAE